MGRGGKDWNGGWNNAGGGHGQSNGQSMYGQSGWGGLANWPAPVQPTPPPPPPPPAPEPIAPPTPQPEVDPDAERVTNAMDYLRKFFAGIGMSFDAELEGVLLTAMKAGYTPADLESGLLMPEIQNTQVFKTRFPGYAARISNGYSAINIKQYLDLENQYRSIMENAGLPRGFYDDAADMGQWIAKNVSPAEIEGRVRLASDAAKKVDPTMRNLMARFYGLSTGDVTAYFLDPQRALPTIEHQYKSAEVASWAQRNGYHVGDMSRYEKLVSDGITGDQAAQGYGTIRQLNDTVGQVASIYGESYSQDDAEQDVFYNKNEKRQKIMRQEAATFGGSSRGSTGSAQRSGY
jgi:hypothetical protein